MQILRQLLLRNYANFAKGNNCHINLVYLRIFENCAIIGGNYPEIWWCLHAHLLTND